MTTVVQYWFLQQSLIPFLTERVIQTSRKVLGLLLMPKKYSCRQPEKGHGKRFG